MLAWLGTLASQAAPYAMVAGLVGLGAVEALLPAREAAGGIAVRWGTNIGLHLAGSVALNVLAPAAVAAWIVDAVGIGWQPVAGLGEVGSLVAGFLLIDLFAYAAHRVQHHLFTLWRFHAVHHADVEMDASTALRHHPVEMALLPSAGIALFVLLGIPVWVASIYALVAIVTSLLQHMNVGQPGRIDRALQAVLVTPGMHRVHHSADPRDHDMNYGAVFSVWDRLFRTYRPGPAAGAAALRFGVEGYTAATYAAPHWGLLLPFRLRRPPASPRETVSADHARAS